MAIADGSVHPLMVPAITAHDLARLIDTLRLERPIVAGHSMGGIAVTAFTREYPLMARAAIAVDIAVKSSREPQSLLQSSESTADRQLS